MAQNRVILNGNSTRVLLELPGKFLSHILLWIQGQFVSFGLQSLFFLGCIEKGVIQ
jgi:hypothetical protein